MNKRLQNPKKNEHLQAPTRLAAYGDIMSNKLKKMENESPRVLQPRHKHNILSKWFPNGLYIIYSFFPNFQHCFLECNLCVCTHVFIENTWKKRIHKNPFVYTWRQFKNPNLLGETATTLSFLTMGHPTSSKRGKLGCWTSLIALAVETWNLKLIEGHSTFLWYPQQF